MVSFSSRRASPYELCVYSLGTNIHSRNVSVIYHRISFGVDAPSRSAIGIYDVIILDYTNGVVFNATDCWEALQEFARAHRLLCDYRMEGIRDNYNQLRFLLEPTVSCWRLEHRLPWWKPKPWDLISLIPMDRRKEWEEITSQRTNFAFEKTKKLGDDLNLDSLLLRIRQINSPGGNPIIQFLYCSHDDLTLQLTGGTLYADLHTESGVDQAVSLEIIASKPARTFFL